MNILVTAGNTLVPIDRVRAITNIFTGRTGTLLALNAYQRGHGISLLTSHPELVARLRGNAELLAGRWTVESYRTFDDLRQLISNRLMPGAFDAVIHSAAVSDYQAAGIYAPASSTRFQEDNGHWEAKNAGPPMLVDRMAGKVKSDEPELWLRLVRTPKLIDQIRAPLGFSGILVKFKLEVGLRDEELLAVAERSRIHSSADLMVANTLEGSQDWAYVGPLEGCYQKLTRQELPEYLLAAVERLHREKGHG